MLIIPPIKGHPENTLTNERAGNWVRKRDNTEERSSGNTDIREAWARMWHTMELILPHNQHLEIRTEKRERKTSLNFIFEAYFVIRFCYNWPQVQTKQFNVLQRFSPSHGAIRQDLHQSPPSQCWKPSLRAFLRSEDQTKLMFHSPVAFLLWNMMKGFNIKLNTASKRLIAVEMSECQNQFPDTSEWWESALNTGSSHSI